MRNEEGAIGLQGFRGRSEFEFGFERLSGEDRRQVRFMEFSIAVLDQIGIVEEQT